MEWQIVHLDKHELVMRSKPYNDKGAIEKTYERVEK